MNVKKFFGLILIADLEILFIILAILSAFPSSWSSEQTITQGYFWGLFLGCTLTTFGFLMFYLFTSCNQTGENKKDV